MKKLGDVLELIPDYMNVNVVDKLHVEIARYDGKDSIPESMNEYEVYYKNKNSKPVYLIDYDKLENQIIEASSNGLNYTIYYGMVSNDDLVKLHNELHYDWDKWISTQREDRTGVDRDKAPQDAPVNYDGSSNAQACINVGRYRLCVGCAHEQTRYCMEDLKDSIHPYEPELSDVMVPNCIYRGGCPEFHECGYFRKFIKWCKENDKDVDFFNIQNRYDAYNEFYKTGIGR